MALLTVMLKRASSSKPLANSTSTDAWQRDSSSIGTGLGKSSELLKIRSSSSSRARSRCSLGEVIKNRPNPLEMEAVETPKHQEVKVVKQVNDYQAKFEEIKKSHPSWIFVDALRHKVFRDHDKVIKFGPGVNLREAQTLRFIRKLTKIPVPEAHVDGNEAIVMNYIEGQTVKDCWKEMTDSEKQHIAEQIRRIIDELRDLRGGTYIGAVERGPAVDVRKSLYTGGPFNTEGEFNDFLRGNMVKSTPRAYREAILRMKADHEFVFTHGDLALRNIIIRDGRIVALLDWESAGWYPEYWEFVKFSSNSYYDGDWHHYAPTILATSYFDELIMDTFYNLFVF